MTDLTNVEAVLSFFFKVSLTVPGARVEVTGVDEKGYAPEGASVHYKVIPLQGNTFAAWTGSMAGRPAEGDLTITGTINATGEVNSWQSSDSDYRNWTFGSFPNSGAYLVNVSGSAADADGDGWSNYFEYLNDMNPLVADAPLSITQIPTDATHPKGSVRLSFPYLRTSLGGTVNNSDKAILLEYATDLRGPWLDAAPCITSQSYEYVFTGCRLHCDFVPPNALAAAKTIFFRLRYNGDYPVDTPAAQ
jgi:hypothetical protein